MSAANPPDVPVFPRRDKLRKLEEAVRARWEQGHAFEADVDPSKETFFVTFPYPYMNGRLHLGHGFTVSKADFTAGYQRLKGKNVLFPFGFHVTGMPISAAANKIKNEMAQFGNPPVMPTEADDEEAEAAAAKVSNEAAAVGTFKAKKTKTVRKTGNVKLQWDILRSMGIEDDQIAKFSEPVAWLDYFPALGEFDLKLFGLHIDWRRSFITSSENKFYDQFIRWQFYRLRDAGKIDFGRRATIFAPTDRQACADHDRSAGEGVGPQEYTLIKLRPLELPESLTSVPRVQEMLDASKVFMVAATLRPETMYGQTNCFVLPTGEYGVYEFNVCVHPGSKERESQVLICSERAAINMSFQDPFTEPDNFGNLNLLAKVKGSELIGLPVKAPKTPYEKVYCLPLLTISMTKGTGVVTSVPSDSTDDYAALRDWQTDEKLRAKHGVTEEMVQPFEVIPVIDIPGMGDQAAKFMYDKLKIKSQNDKKKLEQAKAETYKEGFYKGIMIAGEADGVKGVKVSEAKEIVKVKMCADGEAFIYYEPESEVISRSGDECVVAYLDQWFLKYGEPSWADAIRKHVEDPKRFETYTPATRKAFREVVDWLKEWACSRNFGLGTLVPWDEKFVIESLSDSTIYMAYYTISHLLQGRKDERDYTGDGGAGSPTGIKPEQMTPEVFDYIFLQKEYPADCGIPEEDLAKMRESFEYWYPMNLRVSGRDLIQNHLTMSLYNHAAIWPDRPDLWPKGFFANGFVEVEGKKMSKSEGNFIMMNEAVSGHRVFNLDGKEIVVGWSSDSTRLALASAGDLLDDANFSCEIADKAILRLTTELEWAEQMTSEAGKAELRHDEADAFNFWDKAFDAQMDLAVFNTEQSYDKMRFRDVAKFGFYEFLGFRDTYRDACVKENIPLNYNLVRKFLRTLAIIMSPVISHFAEHIWTEVLGEEGFVCQAAWPEVTQPDFGFVRSVEFLHSVVRLVRVKTQDEKKKRAKKGNKDEIEHVVLKISTEVPAYHRAILRFLASRCEDGEIPEDIMSQCKDFAMADEECKGPNMKFALKKAAMAISQAKEVGPDVAFELTVPYDQVETLESQRAFATEAMQVKSFRIELEPADEGTATPGFPTVQFE